MATRVFLLPLCCLLSAEGELNAAVAPAEAEDAGVPLQFADPNLGSLGQQLLATLQKISNSESFVFGHHATDVLGQHWTNYDATNDSSDVKEATGGSFPGLFEHNLYWVTRAHASNVAWDETLAKVKAKGALLMLHWPVDNPSTCTTEGGEVKNCEDAMTLKGTPIKDILPGGKVNGIWRKWLDTVADFLHKCESHGLAVILRPFHECTGGWFWWGSKMATPSQYKAAWNYTKHYLTEERGVHNALFAYAPSKPTMGMDLAYGSNSMYPGDDQVDIVCFDRYGKDDDNLKEDIVQDCSHVATFAEQHKKVPAICEFGIAHGNQESKKASWFKTDFLDPVMQSDKCRRIAYALTWANTSPESYWVPLPEQTLYPGFKAMAESGHVIFAGDSRLKPAAAASFEDGVAFVEGNATSAAAAASALWV